MTAFLSSGILNHGCEVRPAVVHYNSENKWSGVYTVLCRICMNPYVAMQLQGARWRHSLLLLCNVYGGLERVSLVCRLEIGGGEKK
eukprot:scaffold3340_cov155-Skeletonema_menzelii.AAC.2